MEGWLGVENMYDADPRLARHFEQALKAHALYKRDRDYIVKEGEIVIVDEFTGRQMPGRRWSEGLHQAIEAKEGLRVQRESVTLATITFQNYFRLYDKLSGMTGTAMTEAEEFFKIYQLDVVAVPTHREMIRERLGRPRLPPRDGQVQRPDRRDRGADRVGPPGPRRHGVGREVRDPGRRCSRRGIKHEVLNAKFHEKESGIVAQAGRSRRGDDRHEHGRPRHGHPARRQPGRSRLRHPPQARPQPGRGRQGDLRRGARRGRSGSPTRTTSASSRQAACTSSAPSATTRGASTTSCAAGPAARATGLVAVLPVPRRRPHEALRERARGRPHGAPRAGRRDGDRSGLVSKTIESAQSRVEGYNFDIRKRVVEFDDVINKQRETTYAERDKVLRNEDLTETVRAFLDEEMDALGDTYVGGDATEEWNLDGLSNALHAMGLDGEGTTPDELWELGSREVIVEHLRDLADEKSRARRGGRRGRLVDGRAARAAADDRLAVGRAPHGARRHAPRHRPARLRPAGPPQRIPPRGVPDAYEEFRDLIRHRVPRRSSGSRVQKQPAAAVGGDPAGAAAMAAGVAPLTGARAGPPGRDWAGSAAAGAPGGRDIGPLRRPQCPGAARRRPCHERVGGRRR